MIINGLRIIIAEMKTPTGTIQFPVGVHSSIALGPHVYVGSTTSDNGTDCWLTTIPDDIGALNPVAREMPKCTDFGFHLPFGFTPKSRIHVYEHSSQDGVLFSDYFKYLAVVTNVKMFMGFVLGDSIWEYVYMPDGIEVVISIMPIQPTQMWDVWYSPFRPQLSIPEVDGFKWDMGEYV